MRAAKSYILERLQKRRDSAAYRSLSTEASLIDFCSNDYLGFARSLKIREEILEAITRHNTPFLGSTGSRLISGNSELAESVEKSIADFHGSEAALLFNSGYDANLGIFSSIPQRGDTIIADELIHASILDGCRLSFANKYSFRHNDLESLEDKLKIAKGRIFIAVESIYSMDGDEAPLEAIVSLAEHYGAAVIVDEAHATGIFGEKGKGLVHQYNLETRVFARIVTFGKALGCHGAVVLGSKHLREYLVNFARSFIYTTAAAPLSHLSISVAYRHLNQGNFTLDIKEKILLFKNETSFASKEFIASYSPIQCLLLSGNKEVKQLESILMSHNFNVRAILHPTVALGKERMRFCIHTFNTDDEIKTLAKVLKDNL